MTITSTLQSYLRKNGVEPQTVRHEKTLSASRTAQASHVSGDCVAKGVLMKDAEGYLLAVIPASHHIEMESLSRLTGRQLQLADENEVANAFPDCALGAVPPMGAPGDRRRRQPRAPAGGLPGGWRPRHPAAGHRGGVRPPDGRCPARGLQPPRLREPAMAARSRRPKVGHTKWLEARQAAAWSRRSRMALSRSPRSCAARCSRAAGRRCAAAAAGRRCAG